MPDTETKSAFAARVGVTPGRVSQLIGQGLPLTEDGKRVRVAEALAWLDRTLSPHQVLAQRRPRPDPPKGGPESQTPLPDPPKGGGESHPPLPDVPEGDYPEARRVHEWHKARRAALEYDRARGRVIDADAARQEAFARARAERDSWMAWIHRVAPILAAELRADEHAVFVALQREVDDHLSWLADTPLAAMGASDGDH
ncbi:hypothetical protein [Pararhodospirillum oryzae]|uniref:Terminase small subunit n=1 Tax=Pararhodospirillum oryzae TaxID=478448 RepID=A0A512H6E3_9PROT|nr:hypothetical protein [Pararhodospirillum oryzae]GEO80960.1 hypothetical protein ROR02_10910 [Pararhodospirillum oryzae]